MDMAIIAELSLDLTKFQEILGKLVRANDIHGSS
jgi:hypothetical protein